MHMTRLISAIILLAVIVPLRLFAANEGKVSFKWDTEVHDFGAFNEDVGKVTCYFKGINLGPDTASIVYINASCGCTQPTSDKKVIAPGDSITLTVVYDPAGRPGAFDKKISIGTIPGYHANFHIKGTVISSTRRMLATYPYEVGKEYRISDKTVSFGNTREDRSVTATLRGINTTASNIIPTVTRVPAFVTAAVSPDTVGPGEKFVISLVADGPQIGQLGITVDTMTVSSAAHPEISQDIPLTILLFEEFPPMTADDVDNAAYLTIPDAKVDFGTDIDPESRKAIKRKVRMINEGLQPLIIRRAYSMTPGIIVKTPEKPIAPGKDIELEISLIPADLPAGTTDLRARVSVISNTPLNTTLEININGQLRSR